MNAATADRKYALIRISRGDYLLPSNDGSSLWRIQSYDDEGATVWGGWKYRGHLHRALAENDLMLWDLWDGWVFGQRSRQDVIDEVLT